MKPIIIMIMLSLLWVNMVAQGPRKMSYQAVVRDAGGNLVTNQMVGMRMTILEGILPGTSVYQETQTPTTNSNGLVTIEIGDGTGFDAINWSNGIHFIKTEIDTEGGTDYSISGTSQLLSVPYAFHAKTVETGDNWGTEVIKTDATLSGDGTKAAVLKVADNGITSSKIADATIAAADLANNAVTTDKINAGAVTGVKIAQAGATSGQALKWNGTTLAPAADATGNSSGWTDDGSIIRLTTTTDSVLLGSATRLGKLNIGGNIGMSLPSNIYFGSDATRISGMVGGDMRLVAEDLSMLTTEDITFGHFGDTEWIKFDNANKRVGIGSLSPTDRLHVTLDETTAGLSAVRAVANPATVLNYGVYGESKSSTGYGIYGKSPKYGLYGYVTGNQGRGVTGEATGTASIGVEGIATNTSSTGVWGEGANQGVYGVSNMATGKGVFGQVTSDTGFSGYFDGGKFYVNGRVGIGTTNPARKLYVNGSAEVKDTLYANVVKIENSPRVFYKKFASGVSKTITTINSWGPLDTLTIEAPGPGFVMLNFTGTLSTDHTYLDGTWVGVGISTRPTSNVLAQTWWEFEHQLVGGYYQSPTAVNTVATISTPGTYSYYILGYHWGTSAGEDVVNLNYGSFSALFIPAP